MARKKTTVYIDEALLRAAKVDSARSGGGRGVRQGNLEGAWARG